MLSALKRLTGKGDASNAHTPPGMQTMSHSLQRRFAKGVQYNMKIIIKGDRNVGKTSLFERLQGKKFTEEYVPTEEIQVACIQWNYKATDDVVKVEVWDIVDRGKKKTRFSGLKMDNSQIEIPEQPALDAEFLDVYKGTNGVILMLDVTKNWTMDYVCREMPKVPPHIPVLVMANHRDMGHHRTVTEDEIAYFIDGLERPSGAAHVMYAETSMRNGFGLKFLHKFFNLPFLHLQRETLLQQIETNSRETDLTMEELQVYQESDDSNYDLFIDSLSKSRRQLAESLSPPATSAVVTSNATNLTTSKSTYSVPITNSANTHNTNIRKSNSNPSINTPQHTPLTVTPLATTEVVNIPTTLEGKSRSISNFFQRKNSIRENCSPKKNDPIPPTSTPVPQQQTTYPLSSVDDFIADGELDRSFLEDNVGGGIKSRQDVALQQQDDSDSDNGQGNPLVAGFQTELDPDDSILSVPPVNNISQLKDDNTSDDIIVHQSTPVGNTDNDTVVFQNWLSMQTNSLTVMVDSDMNNNSEDETSYATPKASSNSPDPSLQLLSSRLSSGSTSPFMDSKLLTSKKKMETCREKGDAKPESKKHRKKIKDKTKPETTPEQKKKKNKKKSEHRNSERHELEEFLNGSASSPVDSAYEAI